MGRNSNDTDWALAAAYVEKVMHSQGIANAELHRRGGPSVNTIGDFLNGVRSPDPSTLRKIEAGLRLESGSLRRIALGEDVPMPSQLSEASASVPVNVIEVTHSRTPGVETRWRVPFDGPDDREAVVRLIAEAMRDVAATGDGGSVEESVSDR